MIIETAIILFAFVIFLFIFVLPGIALVKDDQVGLLTKKMFGAKLPEGQIIATKGEIGVQADILMPGLYWRFPVIWRIQKAAVTIVPAGKIGTVESIDGKPIPQGRILGDEVECNSFQDASKFLTNGGTKGPQVAILRPGTYRINVKVFDVNILPAVSVERDRIGVVVALDGKPLPSDLVIAPAPSVDHSHFENGQVFITSGGYRGTQLETLQPGTYYINPLLYNVVTEAVAVVPPGYVAVIISSTGRELERPTIPESVNVPPESNLPVHDWAESLLITDREQRGIWKDPIAPGKYNLNRIAYRAELVPVSAITIDWAVGEALHETRVGQEQQQQRQQPQQARDRNDQVVEFFKFNRIKATSQDGFQLEVDVRLIIRIPPDKAPYVISRFGTVDNLIEQVAHPLIDSSFRNEVGGNPALVFIRERSKFQMVALDKARTEFEKYHVEVQGLLIAYIKVDEKLLATQTLKEIAIQEKAQYEEQANAQEQRIAVAEKTARADQQSKVIEANLSIKINADRADAVRRQAEGDRDAAKILADGEAYKNEQVGKGLAAAYQYQADVLGSERIAAIKIMEKVSDGKVQIMPNVLVTGDERGGPNLLTAFFANALSDKPSEMSKMVKDRITTGVKPYEAPSSEPAPLRTPTPAPVPEVPASAAAAAMVPKVDQKTLDQLKRKVPGTSI